MCCALISIDSTLRSNLSVGLPLDTLLYSSGSLSSAGQHRITESDPYFNTIRKAWSEGLQSTFLQLPPFTPGGGIRGRNSVPASCRSWCGKSR